MCKDTHTLKIKGGRKIYQANESTKIKKDKEGQYIRVKGSMQQEELTIQNIYTRTIGTPGFTKQVLRDLQRDLDSHTIIVENFNTSLSMLDRSMRQKINKGIQDLNRALD